MQKSKLTVFFDGLFWIGIYERIQDGKLEACKITFGAEPKDYEVYGFILKNWHKLRFSPPVDAGEKKEGKMNPKRMQRNVKKQLEAHGTGTKSQQALSLQKEENKVMRKEKSRRQKENSASLKSGGKSRKKSTGEDKSRDRNIKRGCCKIDFSYKMPVMVCKP